MNPRQAAEIMTEALNKVLIELQKQTILMQYQANALKVIADGLQDTGVENEKENP